MSGITLESPRYLLGSLVTHPDSSTSSIVDRHSQPEQKQPLLVLPPAQAQLPLAQEEVPTQLVSHCYDQVGAKSDVQHNSQGIFLSFLSIALATNPCSLDPQP